MIAPTREPDGWTLALDFAATTGWAMGNPNTGERKSGIWEYVRKPKHREGVKFTYFTGQLDMLIATANVTRLVYEQPQVFRSRAANAALYGYLATLQAYCERMLLPYQFYKPNEIKQHATGSSKADKAAMIAVAKEAWPDQVIQTDDQADALWLLDLDFQRRYGTELKL